MMEKGHVTYAIETKENLEPTNLTITNSEIRLVNPYSKITQDNNNTKLITEEPTGEIKKLYELAAQKLKRKDYEEVLRLYEQALKIDNSYFKTWTNLGDTYFWLGDYEKAEKHLLKAIELNEVGYQEHYFLAEVYHRTGNNQKALDHIAYSYMLNKNNPFLKIALYKILNKNNLKLREDRLTFPFEIKKINQDECKIVFQGKFGLNWMPMAICLTCWQMEPPLQDLLNDKQDAINYKIMMYKECISNQFAIIAVKKEQKENLTSKELQLYDVVKNNYLNAILYWEIIADQAPQIILILPKDERDRFVQYIKKYVFEEK